MWELRLFLCAFVVVINDISSVDAIRGCRDCGAGDASASDDYQTRIHFPEDDAVAELASSGGDDHHSHSKQIPLSMMMRLNSIHNASELFDEFIMQPPVLLGSRIGSGHGSSTLDTRLQAQKLEVEASSVPKPALCQPELQTVRLKSNDNDPSLFYFPSCTRIERCGGCCSHDLLSCQPTSTEPISYQVVVTQFVGNNQLVYKGKEVIIVEKHTKCKCDCTTKASDCNQLQVYEKSECRCKCANVEKQNKCENESGTKLWDPKTCSCQCREVQECSTGLIWDNLRCNCVPTPRTKNRIGQDPQDRNRYKLGADRI